MKGGAIKYFLHYLAWFRESNAKYDLPQILVATHRKQQCNGTEPLLYCVAHRSRNLGLVNALQWQ